MVFMLPRNNLKKNFFGSQQNIMKKKTRVQKSDVAAHWACNAKVVSNRTITEQSI